MSMTFLNQQSKLSRILGDSNTGTSDQWPLADRKFELNRGEVKFAEKSKSYWGYATGTVASQAISLPTGFLGIHVLIVNDELMSNKNEMPLAHYGRYINSGEDKFYIWVNASGTRQIKFIDSATDGQTYHLYYFKKPTTDLDGDSDESVLQDQFREASVYYAAAELLPQIGKIQLAEYYKGKFDELAFQALTETEQLFINIIQAYPDVEAEYVWDKDVQGIGTVYE